MAESWDNFNGFPGEEAGAGDTAPVDVAEARALAELIQQIKGYCKEDPSHRARWCTWCDVNTQGTKDPARLPTEMLQAFWTSLQYSPEEEAPPPQPAPARQRQPEPASGDFVDLIKTGQRHSSSWKEAWRLYCDHNGQGTYDPSKHPKEFNISFLEFLGNQGALALKGGPPPAAHQHQAVVRPSSSRGKPAPKAAPPSFHDAIGSQAPRGAPNAPPLRPVGAPMEDFDAVAPREPPAKRARQEFAPVGGGLGGGRAPRPASSWPGPDKNIAPQKLVQMVKDLQRTDPAKKQLWAEFCDLHAGGVRDPSRHDPTTLEGFLSSI